ncbi:MAG TPA: ribose-phosphate diphosphokinase, partial [Candidatus Dormibacteraeota bacterium]|nr:ribose-phosphate diphosphokinase [Candidatus Dormibacteraeota bacterium]
DPITAKLMANIMQSTGANRVICVDLHADAIQGFFDIPVDALTATNILARHVRERHHGGNVVVVSPDVGGTARARALARRLEDASIAIIDKRRPHDDEVEINTVIGEVAGRRCVIIDDLVSTGGTLAGAAHALRESGATAVDVVATHGVLSPGALDRLHAAPIDEVCITDTIPLESERHDPQAQSRLRVLSVAPLLAEAIVRVHEGRSVSELFR